jgi:hypothetical protein
MWAADFNYTVSEAVRQANYMPLTHALADALPKLRAALLLGPQEPGEIAA